MRVIKQRHQNDCGVAALAMLLDKDYGDVAVATRARFPVMPKRGLNIAHVIDIAMDLGRLLRVVYKSNTYLLDHSEGILGMNGGKLDSAGHWVVWKEGCILEPWHEKHAVYGLAEYLQMNKCRTATLLVLEGK